MRYLQLRDRSGSARSTESETAVVERELAGNSAAAAIRFDFQRTRHARREVVAIQKQCAGGIEGQIEARHAAGEIDRSASFDRAAAAGGSGKPVENQTRTGET